MGEWLNKLFPIGYLLLALPQSILCLTVLLILMTPALSWAQPQVWLDVQAGTALYLDPVQSDWVPVTGKQQIPERTFLLVKPDTRLRLFKEAEVYDVPSPGYFFVEDVAHKDRLEVVAALTRIEAAQLPAPAARPASQQARRIGVTYGQPPGATMRGGTIPYQTERAAAIAWFYEQGRLDAALLSLKRMMARYPSLYLDLAYVKQLLYCYEKLELFGFLLDETKRLMEAGVSADYEQTIEHWHDLATQRLLRDG